MTTVLGWGGRGWKGEAGVRWEREMWIYELRNQCWWRRKRFEGGGGGGRRGMRVSGRVETRDLDESKGGN